MRPSQAEREFQLQEHGKVTPVPATTSRLLSLMDEEYSPQDMFEAMIELLASLQSQIDVLQAQLVERKRSNICKMPY